MRRRTARTSSTAILICASVALAACGSDGDDDTPGDGDPADPGAGTDGADGGGGNDMDGTNGTDTATGGADVDIVSRFGSISVSQSSSGGVLEASIDAAFVGFGLELPFGDIESGLLPEADTCEVFAPENADVPIDLPDDLSDELDSGFTALDAGDNIVISSPAGTYATLARQEIFGFVLYTTENEEVPVPVPAGLVADIPGGDFPAFAAVAIPDVAPLTGVTPVGSADENAAFGWDAGDAASSRVDVSLTFFDPADPAETISISCSAVDDGAFELPQSVRDQVPDGATGFVTLSREATVVERRSGAVLVVTSSASSF